MTESEAIEWIKELKDSEEIQEFYYVESFIEAFDIAIQALEKQMPKKPMRIEGTLWGGSIEITIVLVENSYELNHI